MIIFKLERIALLFALLLSVFSLNSQILLNELSPDSGNHDSANDAIVELINYGPSTDAGCMVISNSEWTVVLPPGTTIPVGETFIIACGTAMNTGSNPNPAPGTGLTCAVCDFPNLPLDFDVCAPANAAYINWAATGLTLDNSNNSDGDQVVLFQADGTIADAVQWGNGSNLAGVDNTVISGSGYAAPAAFTIGMTPPPINGSVPGHAELPPALQAGGACFNASISYVMPAIDSGIYYDASPTQKGCNSSMIRNMGNMGAAASGSWGQTEHPNPGEQNDFLAFQFFIDGVPVSTGMQNINSCATPAPVTVSVEIYDYQHVEDDATNVLGSRLTLGSYFSINGSAPAFWNGGLSGVGSGTTTLSHTFTPANNDEIAFVWNDWIQSPFNPNCCGSSSQNVAESGNDQITGNGSDECYEAIVLNYIFDEPIEATALAITCDDATTGNISVSGVTAGTNVTYEVRLVADGSVFASNSTGAFVLPSTAGAASDFEVFAVNPCGEVQASGAVCVGNPPCPDPMGATINGGTAALTICPADCFDLTIDGAASANLPDGGTIDWYFGTDAGFDPFDATSTGFGGLLDNPSDISVTAGAGGGGIIINEVLYDPSLNDGSNPWDESIELFNSSGASIDISNWVVTDGDFEQVIPAGTIVPSDGYYVIDYETALTNSGEQVAIYDGTATFIDGMFYENGQDIGNPNDTDCTDVIPLAAGGTTTVNLCNDIANAGITNAGTATNGQSLELNADGTWSAVSPSTQPLTGGPNTNQTMVSAGSVATVSTANNCFDESFCNTGTLFIKGVINPTPFSASCSEADVTVGTFEVNVVCPTVVLTGESEVCAPATASLNVMVSNAPPSANYTVTINNGGSTFMNNGTTDAGGNGTLVISGINEGGDYSITSVVVTGSSCPTFSGIGVVNVFPQPNVSLTGNVNVCPGEVAELPLTINAGIAPFDVTYTAGATSGVVTVGQTGSLFIPTTASDAGNTINVAVTGITDENGCTGIFSGNATVNVANIPTAPITGTNPDACVANGATTADLDFVIMDTGANTTVDIYDVVVGGNVLAGGNDLAGGAGDVTYSETGTSLNGTFPQTITRYFEITNTTTGCTNFTRTPVSVTVNEQEAAGTPTNTTACSAGATAVAGMTATIDLDDQLSDADAGGAWTQVGTTPESATIDGANVVDFTGLAAGTYTFRYTIGTAPCTPMTSDVEIVVSSCLATSCTAPIITSQPNSQTVCAADLPTTVPFTVAATNSGTGTVLNYQWQVSFNGGTTFTNTIDVLGTTGSQTPTLMFNAATGTPSGLVFRAIITDPIDATNCTSTSNTAILTIAPQSNVTLNDPADACVDGADMAFTATPVNGSFSTTATAGFTFNNAAGTASLDVSAAGAGTYDVTYDFTDANGCMASQTVSVEVFDLPTVTLNDPADACVDDADMAFTATPMNGSFSTTATAGFTFDNAAGTASLDVSAAGAGTYDVTYDFTDANGCMASRTVSVEIFDLPTVTLNDPADACIDGADMAFTATPMNGSFSTTAGAGFTFDNAAGTASLDVSAAGAGTYDVTYDFTDANGCMASQTVSIEVFDLPTVTLNDPADACIDGADMAFTATPMNGSFSTTAGAGFTFDNAAGTASLDVSAAGAGTYDVTYDFTDANGCMASQTVSVEVFDLPTVTLNDPADACIDGADMAFTATPMNGSFSTTAGAGFTFDNAAGTASLDVSAAGAGTYDVTYSFSDANGCMASQTVSVEVFALPTVTLNDPADACIDGTDMAFTATPMNGSFSTTAGAGFTFDNAAGTASLDVSAASAGTYDVTYDFTDANGCMASQTVSVEVFDLPTVTLNDPADACIDGADMAFTATPVNGSFSTTATAGFTFDNAAGTASLDVSAAGAGTYEVTYEFTDANGCAASQTVSVEVFDLPTVTLNDPTDACIDGADMAFTATPMNGSFSTTAGAGFAFDNAAGTASLDVSAAGAGTYDVTYDFTDANGCAASQTVSVEVFDLPTVTLNDPADACVDGADMAFTATPMNGSFSTTATAGFTFDNAAGTASLDVSAVGAGTYDVTYDFTNANGCMASQSVSVEVFDLPTVTLNDPADACVDGADMAFTATPVNGSFSTTATAGFTFDNAAGTASLDVNAAGAGTYDVTYDFTNANGCMASQTVSVEVFDLPTVTLNDPADACIDGADMAFTATPMNGSFSTTATAGFTFDNTAGTASLDVSAAGAGTYDVTYDFTDANGCMASQTVSVEVFATPVANPDVNLPICEGSDIELSANPVDAVTYVWTGPNGFSSTEENPTISATDATYPGAGVFNYNLTISTGGATPCEETYSVEVTVDPAPEFVCRQPVSTTTLPGECGREITLLDPIILDESTGISGISNDAPTPFPVGETIVTWTVTDACGNPRTCEQSVSVADSEGPIFSACNQEIGWTEGNCIANVIVTATASDNCGVVSLTGTGSYQFGIGVHPLILTATDVNGNVTEHPFTVYVHDDVAPTAVLCPESFTVGVNDVVNLPTPSFTDNCEIYTLVNDAPETFEEGTTTVTWTASDYYGLTTDCVYDVTVAETLVSIENLYAIEASIDEEGLLSRVSWNPPTASSQCESCAETVYENYAFLGEFYGHQYFAYTGEKVDWNTANTLAESTFDGHLLSVNGLLENNFVKHHLLQDTDSLWLGLSESMNGEDLVSFAWTNAAETDFFNFGDILSYQDNNGAAIMTASGLWKNVEKTDLHRFIVERPCLDFAQISPSILFLNENDVMETDLLESGEDWAMGTYMVEYRAEDQCGYQHSGFFPVEVSTEVANYCPTGGADSTLWVAQVNIGTDRHESADSKQYANYTDEIIEAETETDLLPLEIVLGGNFENQETYLRIWLDVNEDGDFFDANELVWENVVNGHVTTAEIPVQLFNETGKRLRIATSRYDFAEVCADFFSGETEDYLVRYANDLEQGFIPIIPIESAELEVLDVSITPNPAVDIVTIELPIFETHSDLTIFDAAGQLIDNERIAAGARNFNINFKNRAEGIYFLRLENAGTVIYKKIVVSR